MTELPPFLPFVIGALIALCVRGWLRSVVLLLTPVLGGLNILGIDAGTVVQWQFLDYTLTPHRADNLSLLFGYLFHIAAFIGIVFALHVRDTIQQISALLYASSALGAVFAGDLITLFVFWELMAFTSVFQIWARRSRASLHAGMRYLLIQVLSGVLLLVGTLVHLNQGGSLDFGLMELEGLASWMIFIAFGIKCAFPLMHNWLTDSYPEATPTGAVFLSVFTTKVAVYALARGFAGTELLIIIGATMACFPIFYAVIENDLRRVLAYSLINQLGFMVVGIGIGTELALNGTVAHAFAHVLYKSLLFMSMGSVLYMTGKINGSDLGGLYKSMPKTTVLCIVGAASISAFPLFSGFVSKAMIMSAALEEGHDWVWLILLFAAAGVFHHAGIKIPFFAFFGHDSGIRVKEAPVNMLMAMSIAATLCIAIGVYPQMLYQLLPNPVAYNPYDATHVIAQMQLLFFSALAFVWLKLRGLYPPELHSVNIDAEWIYRRLLPGVTGQVVRVLVQPVNIAVSAISTRLLSLGSEQLFKHHGPQGILARTWPTGSMVLWVAVLLVVYLMLYYL